MAEGDRLKPSLLITPITLFDFETPYEQLNITVTSDNPTLLPTENISIIAGNNSQEALLSISPLDGELGEANINITIEDSDGNSLGEDFTVSVETDLAPVFLETPETNILIPRTPELGAMVADLDADDGNEGDIDLSVSYSIAEGNDLDGDDLEPFIIDIDGEIVVNDVDDIALADSTTPLNLTIEANDGVLTTQANVEIEVNNAPIVANPLTAQTATVDSEFSFQFATNTFIDAEGDNLTYTATLADDSPLPIWLTFNPLERNFSGTPNNNQISLLEVKVTASDGNGSISDTFDLTVANLVGNSSNEEETGTNGNDGISGQEGNDTLNGNGGDDVVSGDEGSDRLFGDEGNDTLMGGADDDYLQGGNDNDLVSGGEGNDFLLGGTGNDTLMGNSGADVLMGNDGDDFLDGGADSDGMLGFGGADTFVLNSGDTGNLIYDWEDGTDFLGVKLSSFGVSTVSEVFNPLSLTQNGTSTEIYSGTDLLTTLYNVNTSDLTEDDFIAI